LKAGESFDAAAGEAGLSKGSISGVFARFMIATWLRAMSIVPAGLEVFEAFDTHPHRFGNHGCSGVFRDNLFPGFKLLDRYAAGFFRSRAISTSSHMVTGRHA